MNTRAMLETHPQPTNLDAATLTSAIDAAFECAQVCTSCADACLAEEMVAELRRCIRLDLDCADVCTTTARILSRQTELDLALLQVQLEACRRACGLCGDECEQHAQMHAHCRVCAEACRRCEKSCNQLLLTLAA